MLKALDDLVESRIRDAQARGEFDDLPGAGQPLPDDDLASVPEDLRVAFRILKNAGCVPPEIEALRDIEAIVARLADDRGPAGNGDARRRAERRLFALSVALESAGLPRTAAAALAGYRERVLERLGR
jgi:hypothetical protein